MTTDYYTVNQVAKKLNLSDLTVRRYIKSKKLNAYKLGREYRIEPEELERFLAKLKSAR